MANRSVIMGGRTQETLISCPYTGKSFLYTSVSNDATAIFKGDFVKSTGAFNSSGIPVVTLADPGDPLLGITSSFSTDFQDFKNYREASTDRDVFVSDDPFILFEIQANGVLTTADAFKRADIIVGNGNTITGFSGTQLDVSTLSDTEGQLQIIRLLDSPDNELGTNTKVICRIAEHEFNTIPDTENYWSRTGTTLSPREAADDVDLGAGDITATDAHFTGKLTVDGLIDPTALLLEPQDTEPSTADGAIYYDSTTNTFKFRENGTWFTPSGEDLWNKAGQTISPATGTDNVLVSTYIRVPTAPVDESDLTNKLYVDGHQPANGNGFVDRADSQFIYNPLVSPATLNLEAVIATFDYYLDGVKYTVEGGSPLAATQTATTGVYYVYIKSATPTVLTIDQNVPDVRVDTYVGQIVFDSNTGDLVPNGFVIDKRYSYLDSFLARELIDSIKAGGAYVYSGYDLSDYTVQPAAPINADNTFLFASGVVKDNDILTTTPAFPVVSSYIPFQRGPENQWKIGAFSAVPFVLSGNQIAINVDAGNGLWVMVPMNSPAYVNYYYIVVPTVTFGYEILSIPGQAYYTTLASAKAENFNDLDLTGQFIPTFAPLYQVTWFRHSNFSTIGGVRIEAVADLRGMGQADIISPRHQDVKLIKKFSDVIATDSVKSGTTTFMGMVSAAGATPVDTDVTAWEDDSFGIVVCTGARVFWAYKNSTDVYYVEITGI